MANASGPRGTAGEILIDPRNITMSSDATSGGLAFFPLVNPDPSSASGFGYNIQPLFTGNVVVTNPNDSFAASNANDQVSYYGTTTLTNGNYVVANPNWNSNTGAATWANGTTGVSGVVSSANSLVGSKPEDQVGYNITTLTNGNYVVSSPAGPA